MEFDYYSPSETFVALTANQFVGRDDGLLEQQKQDSHVCRRNGRHFNLPNHSKQHMVVCGLSLHQGSTESRKTQEQKFIFQIGTLNPHGINERFSFN